MNRKAAFIPAAKEGGTTVNYVPHNKAIVCYGGRFYMVKEQSISNLKTVMALI